MVRSLISSVVVVLLGSSAAAAAESVPSRTGMSSRVITMAVFDECDIGEGVLAILREETARIWSLAGVTIRWVRSSELPFGSDGDWLMVRCTMPGATTAEMARSRIMPVAAIRFVGSRPTNTILVNLKNAMTLLLREPLMPRGQGWFVPFHDTRMGRMLGRAIAHEVGHFLTQSGAHSRRGLMRATHTVAALTGPSLRPFQIDSAQVASLQADRTAGVTP